MKYIFPEIIHISQVIEAIKGCDEFVVAERENYTIINYLVQKENTFSEIKTENDTIKRECRGLIFDKLGNLISRPFHKFFNAYEKQETQEVDLSKPHVILQKIDGSMIRPIPFNNSNGSFKGYKSSFSLGTKMGETDISKQAEVFIKDKQDYQDLIWDCININVSPIFEWTSRKNRIIIDYPKENLTLLAMRNNKSGEYYKYSDMKEFVEKNSYMIPIVEQYEGNIKSIKQLLEKIKDNQEEGFVIRFEDGHMIKCKTEWYVSKHKAKDKILFEKNVISMIVKNEIDDVKVFLIKSDLDRVVDFEFKFWKGIDETAKYFECEFEKIDKDNRKIAAEQIKKYEKEKQSIFFHMLDNNNIMECIVNLIKINCSSSTKIENIRWIFGCNWNESNMEE